jgi:hypothetical protein
MHGTRHRVGRCWSTCWCLRRHDPASRGGRFASWRIRPSRPMRTRWLAGSFEARRQRQSRGVTVEENARILKLCEECCAVPHPPKMIPGMCFGGSSTRRGETQPQARRLKLTESARLVCSGGHFWHRPHTWVGRTNSKSPSALVECQCFLSGRKVCGNTRHLRRADSQRDDQSGRGQ